MKRRGKSPPPRAQARGHEKPHAVQDRTGGSGRLPAPRKRGTFNPLEQHTMKFYIIETDKGETIGCELTRGAANLYAQERGFFRDEYSITVAECPVNADTVRRLLGNLGGYATA